MKRKTLLISAILVLSVSVAVIGYSIHINAVRSEYDRAKALLSEADHQGAYNIFITLGDYKDTQEYLSKFEMLPVAYRRDNGTEGIYIYNYKSNIKGEDDVTYIFDPTYEVLYGDEPVIFKTYNTEYLCEYKNGLLASRTWQDELTFNYTYEFYPDGSVAKKKEKLERGPVWAYSYDADGRLTHTSYTDVTGVAYEDKYYYSDGVLSHAEHLSHNDDGTISTSTTTYKCAPIYIK